MIELRQQPAVHDRAFESPTQLTTPTEAALHDLARPFWCELDGTTSACDAGAAFCPALPVAHLGSPLFRESLGLRANYMAGAMANGIASVELVKALRGVGLLGIFGAAGLPLSQVEQAIRELQRNPTPVAFGVNFIHSPQEPRLEADLVQLLLRTGVKLVEASAFLDLTLPIVKYRLTNLSVDPSGRIIAPNRIIAKVSRVELATKFLSPAPSEMVRRLVEEGHLTPQQAEWSKYLPLAEDITAEADSAGHTDNRPALALLPTLLCLRDRLQAKYEYDRPLHVGLGGGLGSPAAVAAAFAMGAAYVVTGTVNQACVESGSSPLVREMLAEAEQADVCMAPAADMFEMGVKVQVLKRGTLFAMRAAKLYELYRKHDSIDQIPRNDREQIEKAIFKAPLDAIWQETVDYFTVRDPGQLRSAAADPKHRMALLFRWYLGQSSRWANAGKADRQADFQIWCGPAMGAFNEWTRGSFLEAPEARTVALVAANFLHGAAVFQRANFLRHQGVRLPTGVPAVRPLPWTALCANLGWEEGVSWS